MKKSDSNRILKFEGLYDFLSNSYRSTFVYRGIKYRTISHAYYSLRAKHETDAIRIRNENDVSSIIKFGKSVEIADTWLSDSYIITKDLVREKFKNPFLRPRLIETGDKLLGDDRNFMGKILMEVRKEIIDEENNHKDKDGWFNSRP